VDSNDGWIAFNEIGVVLVDEKIVPNISINYDLNHNDPNPFYPTTAIKYSIPSV
jgi:hypothetical protein